MFSLAQVSLMRRTGRWSKSHDSASFLPSLLPLSIILSIPFSLFFYSLLLPYSFTNSSFPFFILLYPASLSSVLVSFLSFLASLSPFLPLVPLLPLPVLSFLSPFLLVSPVLTCLFSGIFQGPYSIQSPVIYCSQYRGNKSVSRCGSESRINCPRLCY